jgi:hypothetical protein
MFGGGHLKNFVDGGETMYGMNIGVEERTVGGAL